MSPLKTATLTWLALASSLFPMAALGGECRIGWHPGGKGLLAVYKDGRPYKGRAYLSHDDVVMLRRHLVSAGDCTQSLARERCSVRTTSAGAYQIHFGAQPLYADELHRSRQIAAQRMADLVKMGFCQPTP